MFSVTGIIQRSAIRTGLLRLIALGLTLSAAGWAAPAFAACSSFSPTSGATVDCTGTSSHGVLADGSANVTVEVHSGATIAPDADGALDPPHVNWGIDVGTNARITIEAGGSVDLSARSQQQAIRLNSGSTLIINGTVKGSVTGGVAAGFSGSTITIGATGQVTGTTATTNPAVLNGSGGGNAYEIDGLIQTSGVQSSGIQAGANDQITLGATGHIVQSLGGTPYAAIYGNPGNHVSVATLAGSQIDSQSSAINLGTNAVITVGGNIHALAGNGIGGGAGSTFHLERTGTITNDAGGAGISLGANSTATIDGTISMGGAGGQALLLAQDSTATINSAITIASGGSSSTTGVRGTVGTSITLAQTGSIAITGPGGSAAFYLAPATSLADNTVTLDIAGQVTTANSKGIFFTATNAIGSSDVSAHANVTIEAGGSLIASNNKAYTQDDGSGSFPEVIDNLIVAGHIETGVVNGIAIDLNDGADTITLLPTYSIIGKIDGGSDAAGAAETDTLAFDGAAGTSGTFSFDATPVLNFEAGHKTGAGSWTLAGTAGTGLSGNFAIDAGRLAVNGTMTSTTFTVNSGGTLGGIGTVGAVTILAGGVHAPGNSIGTQTIAGNYVNHGTLQVEVSPAAADKVVVNGTVDIAGAALVLAEAPAGGWATTQSYTIIDNNVADAVTGTFASVTDNFAFLDPTVSYTGGTGNDVVLTLDRNAVAFADAALTPNQTAVAGGAEALGGDNPIYDAIVPLSAAQARDAFDQLSGEVHASLAGSFASTGSRPPRDAALARIDNAFAAIDETKRVRAASLWSRVVGSAGVVIGDGNAAATGTELGGVIAGLDGWLSDRLMVGTELGITATSLAVPNRSSSAAVESVHAGVYGGLDLDPLQLGFGAALSDHFARVTRSPSFAGVSQTLGAETSGVTAQLFGEIGYAFRLAGVTVSPFAGLALVHQLPESFAETGGSAALSGDSAAIDAAALTLGARVSSDLVLPGDTKARVSAVLGWEQTLGPKPSASVAFAGGTPFTVAGASLNSGALALAADVELDLGSGTTLHADYSGHLGGTGEAHALTVTFAGHFQ